MKAKAEMINRISLILTVLLFLGCCGLGVYSYSSHKELGKYQYLYRCQVICRIADYFDDLETRFGVSILGFDRIPHQKHLPYTGVCVCPREKEAELDKELQQTEQLLELQLADWHGYICPDLVLTVTKREPGENERGYAPESFIVYEMRLNFNGFRAPTPTEQQKVLNVSISKY